MKGKINKIKSILALLLFIILTSNSHLLMSVATEDNLPKEDVKAEVKLESNLEKYVSYELEGKKAKLVQIGLKTGIEFENEEKYVPLRATGIVVNTPKIDGMYPFNVDVIGKSTQSTNGSKLARDFKLEYDKENGQVKLVTFNQANENGETFTGNNKDLRDSFSLVLNYAGNDEEQENEEKEINFKGVVIGLLANEENTKVMQEFDGNVKVKDDISGLVSTNVTVNKVFNGYIKSNKVNDTKYTTDFKEILEINISKANIAKEVKVDLSTLLKNENGENTNTDDIIYKSLTLNKQEILNVLGEDGYFKIIDKEQNEILNLNKDTEDNENGTLDVKFENEVSNLTVVFSKPQTVGNINILINKQIKDSVKDISLNEIEDINSVKCVNYEEIKYTENDEEKTKEEEKQVYTYEDTYKTQIHDSEISIELNLNERKWTNEKQNEVNFEIKLLNNWSKYDLFENPSFEIKLPEQVQKVVLDNPSIIYANGLEVKSTTYDENTKIIKIETTGKQTKYLPEEITDGTKIIVPATIILNSNIDNEDYNLSLNYKTNDVFTNDEVTGQVLNTVSLENFTQEIVPVNNNLKSSLRTMSRQQNTTTQEAQQTRTLQTVEGIDLTVKPIKGDVELNNGDIVYEGEFIKYEITAKNTTENDIDNVKIDAVLPEGVTYGKLVRDYNTMNVTSHYDFTNTFEAIDLGTIKAGKSQTTYIEVRANDLQDEETQKDIVTTIKAYIGDSLSNEVSLSNKVEQGKYKVTLNSELYRDNEFRYYLHVESEENEQASAKIKLPECMELQSVYDCYGENIIATKDNVNEDNVLSFDLNTNEKYSIYVKLHVEKIYNNDNSNSREINTVAIVNDKYISNEDRINAEYRSVSINMSSPTEGEKVTPNDYIDYKIEVTNTGKNNSDNADTYCAAVILKDVLPEQLIPEQVTYNKFTRDDENNIFTEEEVTQQINNEFELYFIIPYGKTVTLNVKAKAFNVVMPTKITNSASVRENTLTMVVNDQELTFNASFAPKTSNEVSHIILPINEQSISDDPVKPDDPSDPTDPTDPTVPDNPDDPTNPDDSKKYNISGYAWNDKNGDGIKQNDEEVLKGIKVYLLKENGQLLRTTQTLDEGTYYFEEVEQGKYIVLFKYDNNKYQVTKYQASGISNDLNSNANKQNVTIQGEKIDAGVTDIIDLNKDAEYINIGLVENKKFDFRIDNYITKVTVKTKNGTKEFPYNYTNLAKAEVKAKEIEGSSIEVEYKIIVTNNGEINGTVDKIVDYLPEGLFYSDAQGTSWMRNVDGSLINTSLSNKIIEPGKSEEITLIATKSLTEDSMGTLTNKVKIESTSNELNLQETSKENNTSTCELIVSISTGLFVMVTIISIILIALLVFLNIKFNIFKKLPFRFLSIMIVIGISIFGYGIQQTKAIDSTLENYGIIDRKELLLTLASNNLYRFKNIEPNPDGWADPTNHERRMWGSIYGDPTRSTYEFNLNYVLTTREDENGNRYIFQVHNYTPEQYGGNDSDFVQYPLYRRPLNDFVINEGEDDERTIPGLWSFANEMSSYGNNWVCIRYTGSNNDWNYINSQMVEELGIRSIKMSEFNTVKFISLRNDARAFIEKNDYYAYGYDFNGLGNYLCIDPNKRAMGEPDWNGLFAWQKPDVLNETIAWNGESNHGTWGAIINAYNCGNWRGTNYVARFTGNLEDTFTKDIWADSGHYYNNSGWTDSIYSRDAFWDEGGIYHWKIDTNGSTNILLYNDITYEEEMWKNGKYTEVPEAPEIQMHGNTDGRMRVRAEGDNYIIGPFSLYTSSETAWGRINWNTPYDFSISRYSGEILRLSNNDFVIQTSDGAVVNNNDVRGRMNNFYIRVNKSKLDPNVRNGGIFAVLASTGYNYEWEYEGRVKGCLLYQQEDGIDTQRVIDKNPKEFTVKKQFIGKKTSSIAWYTFDCGLRIEKFDQFDKNNNENVFKNNLQGIKFKIMKYTGTLNKYLNNWLVFDNEGNLIRDNASFNQASVVETDSQGKTKTIVGLEPGMYAVYEDSVPSDRGDIFRNPSNHYYPRDDVLNEGWMYKTGFLYIESISPGMFYWHSTTNNRKYTSLQLHKIGDFDSNGQKHNLSGVSFRLVDRTSGGKYVVFRKDTYEYRGWNESSGLNIDAGLSNTIINNSPIYTTEIETGANGLTPMLNKLPIGRRYALFETVGRYSNVYEDKMICEFTTTAEMDGVMFDESNQIIENEQVFGALKIVKKEAETLARLEGIEFKIRIKTRNGNAGFVHLDTGTNNASIAYADSNEIPDDATTFITNSNGEVQFARNKDVFTGETSTWNMGDAAIVRLPLKDFDGNDYLYDVYETKIPEQLQDYFTLDGTNETERFDIIDETGHENINLANLVAKDIKLIKLIDPNDDTKSVVTYASNLPNANSMREQDKYIENKQNYITLKGFVWEELLTGKNTVGRNDVYNEDFSSRETFNNNTDRRFNEIPVSLIDKDGNVVKRYATDRNGRVYEAGTQETKTSGNGEYEFKFVRISKLNEYRIRFVYDGYTYENVLPYNGLSDQEQYPTQNTSKSNEDYYRLTRKQFNSYWKEITGSEEQRINNGRGSDVQLQYREDSNGMHLNQYTTIGRTSSTNAYSNTRREKLRTVKSLGQFQINADTWGDDIYQFPNNVKKTRLSLYYENLAAQYRQSERLLKEINNLNLGLYKREMPNLTLQKDTYKADVSINGKKYTYMYNQKLTSAEAERVSLGVDFDGDYSLPIYEADVNYDDGDPNLNNELNASITYKIKLQNASTNLYTEIKSLNEYFTHKYVSTGATTSLGLPVVAISGLELDKDGDNYAIYLSESNTETVFNDTNRIGVTVTDDPTYSGMNSNMLYGLEGKKINFNSPIQLASVTDTEASNTKYLYIRFKIRNLKDYYYSVKNISEEQKSNSALQNYAEIGTYSVYSTNRYDEDSLYAGVDSTSRPTNMNPRDFENTNEDDSDKAPGLRITENEPRTIEGKVFEDAPVKMFIERNGLMYTQRDTGMDNEGIIGPGDERIGNGVYDEGTDTPIEGIEVQLVKTDSNGKVITDSNGKPVLAEVFYPNSEGTGGEFAIPGQQLSDGTIAPTIKTDANGDYLLPGYIPGNYVVTFVWGKDKGGKDVRKYKSTVFMNYSPMSLVEPNYNGVYVPLNWVDYEEPRYSDAVDDYIRRLAIDKVALDVDDSLYTEEELEQMQYLLNSAEERKVMYSYTPLVSLEVEKQSEVAMHPGPLTGNEYFKYNIKNIDFGIIERPRQGMGIQKFLKTLKITAPDGRPVVIATIGEDGRVNAIAGESYLSGGYDLGYLWAQIDKNIQESMEVKLEYEIKVTCTSERDYDDINYYIFGKINNDNVLKLRADGLYDYLGGSSLSAEDDKWETANLSERYITTAGNIDNLSPTITEEEFLEMYEQTGANRSDIYDYIDTNYHYEGFEIKDSNGNPINYGDRAYVHIKQLYEKWATEITENMNTKSLRNYKLKGKEILKGTNLNDLTKDPYSPGETRREYLKASKIIANGDEIDFTNEAELSTVKVDTNQRTGRRADTTSAPLYDNSEWVTISPATGENRDYTGIVIIGISTLILLASGIILIKRFIRKR